MDTDSAKCPVCEGLDHYFVSKQPSDYEYFVEPERELQVFHCKQCDSEFVHPRPTVEELVSFYPLDYHTYNDDHGLIAGTLVAMRSGLRARLFNKLIETRPIHLFDVGAGDCRHFNDMSKHGDFQFAGVEIKPEMVAAASSRGYHVEPGTIEEMDTRPYEDSYDLVTMYQLVEHVLDPPLLFERARSILKPGGYVMGQLPTMDCIERKIFGRYWAGYHYPRHLQMLTRRGLDGLLKAAGFTCVSVKSALHIHAAQSMQNFLVGGLGYRPRIAHGKTPVYSSLLLMAAPFCLVEHLIGRGGMMNFMAQKPPEDELRETGRS
jgi:SAM-dependent methyltransferase